MFFNIIFISSHRIKILLAQVHFNGFVSRDADKENDLGGHPSKFFACNQTSIIHLIELGRLDTAVQATHFINFIFFHTLFILKQSKGTLRKWFLVCYKEESAHIKEDLLLKAAEVFSNRIRWEDVCMYGRKGGIHFRLHYNINSKAWKGKSLILWGHIGLDSVEMLKRLKKDKC